MVREKCFQQATILRNWWVHADQHYCDHMLHILRKSAVFSFDLTNPPIEDFIAFGNLLSCLQTSKEGTEHHNQVFSTCSRLMLGIMHCPVPVIAVVQGLAAAAGCQLVATCDIAICTENSSFSTPG
jgi:hypothetical protein